MGRPRTRSLTKAGIDHNEDIGEIEQTGEIEIPLLQQHKPNVQTRQTKLIGQTSRQSSQQPEHGQSKQNRVIKSASIGRPRKSQSKKRLSSINKLKHTKQKRSGGPNQKSKSVPNIIDDDEDDEDEIIDMEEDYDNEGYDDDYDDDEDEVIFEEVDDPRDKDYSPNVNIGSRTSRGKMDFYRTSGTRLPNKLVSSKRQSPIRPEIRNLIQGSPSSRNIPNLIDPSMMPYSPKISLSQHQDQLQYPNYAQTHSQGENTNGSTSSLRMVAPKPINPVEKIMPQINNNCIPVRQIPPPRIVPIPTGRNDVQSQQTHSRPEISQRCETEPNHNSKLSPNESQGRPNSPSQINPHRTENISSRNIQDQSPSANHQPNQEPFIDAAESTQSNNTYNTAHISEPQETGRTSCDICNSTGCTTQKTSTTITIKMTTVTEADQYGNMTTRTFVETDISPVTGTIESTEQTEITVETSEHPPRSNVASTTSVVTDQNRPNEASLPTTPQEHQENQETEVQESEKNQNHIDQQSSQKPVSSTPIFDPIFDPVSDPDPDLDPDPDPVSNSVLEPVVPRPITELIPKSIPHFISHLPKITAGLSSSPTQSQAARLENANVMQHNQALKSLLNASQQNQLNLTSSANSSQSQQPRINRPILPFQNRPSPPRPEKLKHNIESIVNPVDSPTKTIPISPSNLVRNQPSNLATPANSVSDVVRTNSSASVRDINRISDGSPSMQQSQQNSNKKKTRKRSAPKTTASPSYKRKNQRILPNKSPSEPQIVISPYMMRASNNFTGNNSSMQDVTSSSTEGCPSQQSSSYKPLTSSTTQSVPYFNSVTPPRPPIFNANGMNTIPTITPPHINSSEKSRRTSSTTPHSSSTIQPSNCSTPQVSSSSNTCVIRDSFNNPFVVPGIGESSSENTPILQYNSERLIRSGSSSKTISTNGGGVGYDSRSSSVANSIEQFPPYYHIPPIETIGSVIDIWNEWSAGINGNPSVILMMERYGVKWVYENEYHLKKRRIIVKEVQVRSEQIGIYEALAELERLRSGNSLLWLADRIRTREQEKNLKNLSH